MTPLLEDEYDIHYGDYGYDDGDEDDNYDDSDDEDDEDDDLTVTLAWPGS